MTDAVYLLYYEKGDVRNVTVTQLESWLTDQTKKNDIAEFIGNRLKSRYLKPFEYNDPRYKANYKNGFAIMACCCLLIETLQCFYEGYSETPKNHDKLFKRFFKRAKDYGNPLGDFLDTSIYTDIRCGILHQGETKNGFLITRDNTYPICDMKAKRINATKFLAATNNFIDEYVSELKSNATKWDSEIWDNCRRKLRGIINNTRKHENH
jgi:hypothetical protein